MSKGRSASGLLPNGMKNRDLKGKAIKKYRDLIVLGTVPNRSPENTEFPSEPQYYD